MGPLDEYIGWMQWIDTLGAWVKIIFFYLFFFIFLLLLILKISEN